MPKTAMDHTSFSFRASAKIILRYLLCSVLEMDFHPLISEYEVVIKVNTVMNYGL